MNNYLKKIHTPYPYLFNTRRNFIIASILSITIFLINYYFTSNINVIENYYANKIQVCLAASIITFFSIVFFSEIIPKLFFSSQTKENWNVLKEFLFTLGILIVIALFQTSTLFFFKNNSNGFIYSLVNTFLYTIIIGTLPILLIIWANYVVILKENLNNIKIYNTKLKLKLKEHEKENSLSIKTNNINETLIINFNTFIFAKSEGNYVDIYTKDMNKTSIKPYRISLQKLVNNLSEYTFIFSPHRSYIINVKNIKQTSGNARNYKISFHGISQEVPVSRKKFKLFKKVFNEYYNKK